jgi:hypothetical protein
MRNKNGNYYDPLEWRKHKLMHEMQFIFWVLEMDWMKAPPMGIIKAHNTAQEAKQNSGPIPAASKPKGWVDAEFLIKMWINCAFLGNSLYGTHLIPTFQKK